MATGDKIFLADKETLDLVEQLVRDISDDTTNIKQGNESLKVDTASIKQSLSQLPDRLLLSLEGASSKDYMTAAEVSKLRYGVSEAGSDGSININLSGPGELYSIIYETALTTQLSALNTVNITVDGVQVYKSTYVASTPTYYGLITPTMILSNNGINATIQLPIAPNLTGNSLQVVVRPIHVLTGNSIDSQNKCVYLPKNLRFSNISISVTAVPNGAGAVIATYGRVYYMYKLD